MKKFTIATILLIFIAGSLFAENKKKEKPEFNKHSLNSFMKKVLPGGEFFTTYLEAYAPDATLMNEENNGFGFLDNPRVSFEGESFYNFNWYAGKNRINSALNPGSSTVIMPLGSVSGFQLEGEAGRHMRRGLEFSLDHSDAEGSQITGSWVNADMGGYFKWAKFLITSPAIDRADKLYNTRREIESSYYGDYTLNKKLGDGNFHLGMSWFDIKRKFNDFNSFDTTFGGRSRLFTMLLKYSRETGNNGNLELFAVYNNRKRAEQNAEYGLLPQESSSVKRNALVLGSNYRSGKLTLGGTISFEDEKISPYTSDFSKDMKDLDGDIFFPSYKLGDFKSFIIDAEAGYKLTENNEKLDSSLFADIRISRVEGKETVFSETPVYFDQNPFQIVKWNRGAKYTNINAKLSAGVNGTLRLSENSSLSGKLFLTYQRLGFDNSDNNIDFVAPGADIELSLLEKSPKTLRFALGMLPVDVRENVNRFLETDSSYGEIYYWNDENGDRKFNTGETGDLYGYTGGKYHSVKDGIKAPMKFRFLVEYTTPMSRNWNFRVKGIFNKMFNSLSVRHPEEYGFYEKHGEYDLYFYDKVIKEYMLTNGKYDRDPMSAHLLFEIKGGVEKKWFFNFSFLTHFILGNTAFGNGPATNDIGIIDESSANPNSWINSYGRVDGDRAFMGKLYAGFFVLKNLSLGISVKYRDGDPFAFINYANAHNQYAMYYTTIKALDEKGSGDGPREDYLADLSMKATYYFKLFGKESTVSLAVFNILDIGYEISEYAFDINNKRYPNELNMPRSMRLTFSMKF